MKTTINFYERIFAQNQMRLDKMHPKIHVFCWPRCAFCAISLLLTLTAMGQDFHAVPGMDTGALQAMIDKASSGGGGRVTFSRGSYLIGQLELKSGVELYLEEGAQEKSKMTPGTTPKNRMSHMCSPPLYARNVVGLAV